MADFTNAWKEAHGLPALNAEDRHSVNIAELQCGFLY